MSHVDRAVRRARRHLDGGEALVASAVGRELEGRRGRVVLVTDRRVVVAWNRAAPPDAFPVTACSASHDRDRANLTVGDGESSITVTGVDPADADQIVGVLSRWAGRPLAERIGPPFHVRVIGA